MLRPTLLMRLAATVLLLCASSAHAQYSWIGENGVRQFSDRPPPPSTPPHKILKAPGRSAPSLQAPSPATTTPAAPAASAKAAPTLVEREAAYRDRIKQRDEQDKKEQQEAQRRRDLAEHCTIAREAKAQAESDMRVGRVDAKGERSYLTDEEKAALAARANKILAQCR